MAPSHLPERGECNINVANDPQIKIFGVTWPPPAPQPTITLSEISPGPVMLMKPQYEIISSGSNPNISALTEELALNREVNRAETVNSNEFTGWLSPRELTGLLVTDNSDKLVTVHKFSEGFYCFSVLSN